MYVCGLHCDNAKSSHHYLLVDEFVVELLPVLRLVEGEIDVVAAAARVNKVDLQPQGPEEVPEDIHASQVSA